MAKYKNKDVKLNKPFRTPGGPKKFSVYVKNDKGNVVKVNFGDPDMEIKRDDPERRKSFRARHNCDQKKDKTTAGYWSCKFWSSTDVSKLLYNKSEVEKTLKENIENTGVYPVFYIRYTDNEDLQRKLNLLSAPLNAGDGYETAYDAPQSGYGVSFDASDKMYPYMDDFSDYKQQVIECANALSETQINKIVDEFVNYGQDILFNNNLNVFCYFVGDNGEDLTKSVWNNSIKVNREMKRNIQSTPITPKPIPEPQLDMYDMDMAYLSIDPLEYVMDIENKNEDKKVIKENVDGAKYYCIFKIPIFSPNPEDTKDSVSVAKKLLKKAFKIKFTDKPERDGGDKYRQSIETDSGVNYQYIILSEPIGRDTALHMAKSAVNYGTSSLRLNLYDKDMSITIDFDVVDSIQDYDIPKRARSLNQTLQDMSMRNNMDSLVMGVDTFNKELEEYKD